ncbi:retrovirus-related pol polyprotein from transposon TNT 1-94, partial [Tanacetum coccineum]
SGNTKKDRITRPLSSNENKNVEARPRKVNSSLNKINCVVKTKGTAVVQLSKINANSELKCVQCNGCMFSDNHDLRVLECVNEINAKTKFKSAKKSSKKKEWKPTGKVFTTIGYIWRPSGRTFTIVGDACPLTRITSTQKVPLKEPIHLEVETLKPVIRDPQFFMFHLPLFLNAGCLNCPLFVNDHVAKIMEYGDYQIGNVTISRVYYVEGLGYNLFSIGQFCYSNLEVAFRQHTCYICNLKGVDLLIGSRSNNLYTLSLGDMMASSPICLLSKASKAKSWLWHRQFSHLNFGAIKHLAKNGLVRGLPKLKFKKDHLCSACAIGKSKKKTHKPKSENTNQEILYLQHMDLYGPIRTESINGKKYILVIVDDYSSVDALEHEVIAPVPEVVALAPVAPTGTSSISIDQDAPSPSNSQTTPKIESSLISNDDKEENHNLDFVHMHNFPFFGVLIPEVYSDASSSSEVIPNTLYSNTPINKHVNKRTKDLYCKT